MSNFPGKATPFNPPAASLTADYLSLIFDTTRSFIETATNGTTISVGSYRHRHPQKRIIGFIDATTNNVTARLDYLNASGTWSTSAKSATVTAGTTLPINWLANSADWRLVTLNQSAGSEPTVLRFSGFMLVDNPDSGT